MAQLASKLPKQAPLIRPATEKDATALSTLLTTSFAATFGHSMPLSDLQAHLDTHLTPSALLTDLQNPLTEIFVAISPSSSAPEIMGVVQLTQGTTEECVADAELPIELQRLYIDERWHGSGVGGALVRFVENLARERGFRTMWLGVWEENLKAQGAYGRFGFERVGSHDFTCGTCVQTDWILSKTL